MLGGSLAPLVVLAILIGTAGLVVGVLAVIVLIVAKRRLAWLVCLAAVAMWVVLFQVLKPRWAPDMTTLDLDLMLTLLLTVAAVVLARGMQREVDAFEITVTMAVTFLVIELPMVSGLMPFSDPIALWLAVAAGESAGKDKPATLTGA